MIPIKDSPKAQRFPFVNYALILANALVFLFELTVGRARLEGLIHHFGLIPARLLAVDLSAPASLGAGLLPLFTSLFLHGGWVHLLGNLLFLWIFGDNVEDRLGHFGYLAFYFLAGVGAGLAHAFLTTAISGPSVIPTIGASGAIAGVMGAYIVLYPRARILTVTCRSLRRGRPLYPRARILTLMPLLFYFWFVQIPAWFYLGLWIVFQLFTGLLELTGEGMGIAWWAHLGGFVAGLVLVVIFPKSRRHRYQVAP